MSTSRITSSDRVRRVLSVIPYVAAHPEGVAVEELCRRFAIPRRTLIDDLTTASFVGVAPFTPDSYVEVVLDGDRAWVHLPQWFDRPLRLTPAEGLALVAAGQSLLGVEGADATGPLARGIAKVAEVLGVDPGEDIDVQLGAADPGVLATLRSAIDEHHPVALRYYSYHRDVSTDRVVEPHHLHAEHGSWYLTGRCRSADDVRVFRVDRIESVEVLDEDVPAPERSAELGVFTAEPGDPRVVLELSPEAAWVVEQYPVEAVEELDGGRLRVRLAVAAPRWLERLLLRLGPAVDVVEAPPLLADAGRRAARRVLDRYRSTPR